MAIIFRLPTWNTTFTPYIRDNDTGTWAIGQTFLGQLYTMKRVAEVLGPEAMYIVFPKEENQFRRLATGFALDFDVVTFVWRGITTYYFVGQYVPRWLGFPNEHKMVLCAGMDQAGIDIFLDNLQAVDVDLSGFTVAPDSILADDTDTSLVTAQLLDSASTPVAGKAVVITTTGAGTIDTANGVTNGAGQYSTTYHSGTIETCTFSADVPSQGITVGPSPTLTVQSPPDPADVEVWESTITGIADAPCLSCTNANGSPVAFSRTGATTWASTPFSWICAVGATEAFWTLVWFPGDQFDFTLEAPGAGVVVSYTGELPPEWNGADAITLTLNSGAAYCTWPATVDVVPA